MQNMLLRFPRERQSRCRRKGGPANTIMTTIHLERREPVCNRQRFYTLTVARTLFDGWALVREWGRIGHPGTVRETWFETEAAAIDAGAKIRRQKEKRGYRAVNRVEAAS